MLASYNAFLVYHEVFSYFWEGCPEKQQVLLDFLPSHRMLPGGFLNKVMSALLKSKALNSVVCLAAIFQDFELYNLTVLDDKAVSSINCILHQFLVCE